MHLFKQKMSKESLADRVGLPDLRPYCPFLPPFACLVLMAGRADKKDKGKDKAKEKEREKKGKGRKSKGVKKDKKNKRSSSSSCSQSSSSSDSAEKALSHTVAASFGLKLGCLNWGWCFCLVEKQM